MIGMRYPFEVNLVGDARATLERCCRCCERKNDRSWRERSRATSPGGGTTWQPQARVKADPINPMQMFHDLSPAAARRPHPRGRLGIRRPTGMPAI